MFTPMIETMKQINEKVAEKYCKGCLVGEAYKLLKYESYGTFIDHNFYTNDIPIRYIVLFHFKLINFKFLYKFKVHVGKYMEIIQL